MTRANKLFVGAISSICSVPSKNKNIYTGRQTANKPLVGAIVIGSWPSGDGTSTTLHINPVFQPSHQLQVSKLCVHVPSLIRGSIYLPQIRFEELLPSLAPFKLKA
jgi:hypothetical protein